LVQKKEIKWEGYQIEIAKERERFVSRSYFTRTALFSGHERHPIDPPDIEGKMKPLDPIPRDEVQQTGMEAAETSGVIFDDKEVLTGPFGTKEHPVIVKSHQQYRIIACLGGNGHLHEIAYHMLKPGRPLMCLECTQFFKLEPHDHGHGHDDHGHGHGGHDHGHANAHH